MRSTHTHRYMCIYIHTQDSSIPMWYRWWTRRAGSKRRRAKYVAVCVYVCMCVGVCVYTSMWQCVCMCVCVCFAVLYTHTHIYLRVCTGEQDVRERGSTSAPIRAARVGEEGEVSEWLSVCASVSVSIMFIRTHTHTHTYIFMHAHIPHIHTHTHILIDMTAGTKRWPVVPVLVPRTRSTRKKRSPSLIGGLMMENRRSLSRESDQECTNSTVPRRGV
jgi:hypothetical protein